MLVLIFLTVILNCSSTLIKISNFKDLCPNKIETSNVLILNGEARSSIECVALCQQDDQCSSVHYHNNQCSLFIGNETSCDERTVPRTSGHKYLERISSKY